MSIFDISARQGHQIIENTKGAILWAQRVQMRIQAPHFPFPCLTMLWLNVIGLLVLKTAAVAKFPIVWKAGFRSFTVPN